MRQLLTNILYGLALMVLVPSLAWAQSGTVEGNVVDSDTGDPLPGSNVVIVELSIGAAADAQGNFTISDVPAGTYTLQGSFVGYQQMEQSIEVTAGETVTANLGLEPDLRGLEEVVVTGLASSRSKTASEVAVSSVSAEELTKGNTYSNVSQVLGGKAAGVNVQPSSGNVGGGIRFNIRGGGGLNGEGQPVIYVDGVRIDNSEVEGFDSGGQGTSTLADLNPEDIASIDILKGPAGAAIYGTDGSNGVVLITTKRGNVGQGNVRVNYKGTFGYNERQEDYDDENFVTADAANDLFVEGDIQQHALSASGGSDAVSYFASVTNRTEEGILLGNQGERTNFRANFEAFPNEEVTMRASAAYTINEINRPQNDNNIFGQLGNTLIPLRGFGLGPYSFIDSTAAFGIEDDQLTNRFIGSLSASYAPQALEGLTFSFTGGYDGSSFRQDQNFPANFSYTGITSGERATFQRINNQFNANADVQYVYDITDKLSATSILGGQILSERLQTFFGSAQNFSTELITDIAAGSDIQSVGEAFNDTRSGGIFAQQDFSYDDTYFVTLQIRRDFATQLGDDAAAIYYPGVRGSVRLDRLFAPDFFSLLKLRAAYGETGVLPDLLDGQLRRFDATPSGFGAGATLFSVGDPAIEPERVREIEGGVDLELLNRYSLEATYFRTFADNSIVEFDPAPSTGFGLLEVPRNVGGITSQGVELALGLTPVRTRQNQLDFNFTYTYQTSEVTDLGGAPPIFSGFDNQVIKEGLPRNAFFAREVNGALFDENGAYAGVDVAETATFQGVPTPQHYGGLNINLRLFRNLNITALTEYALGQSVANETLGFVSAFPFNNNAERERLAALLGLSSTLPNADEIEPLEVGTEAYREAANAYARTDSRFPANYIEEADYLKLREVSLRYDFSSLLERAGLGNSVRSFNLGVSGRNLITITDYRGPDPEVNFTGSRSRTSSQDFLTLQNPRQFYFTVSVGI